MYSCYSGVLYCVGFGLVPQAAPCLIERRSRRGELVSFKWQTAFVCGKGKEMVRTGPEAPICCWQTDSLAHLILWAVTVGFHPLGITVFVHTASCS